MSESRCELERGGYMYPEALNDLENPPARLYVRGDPAVLKAPSLSIVGARSATPYGLAISEMAARLAVEAGLVVVSGGALGCDGAAGRPRSLRAVGTWSCLGPGQTSYIPGPRTISSRMLFERAVPSYR